MSDNGFEEMTPGRRVKRDPETGQIIEMQLDPEVAAEMGRRRAALAEQNMSDNAAELLAQAGYIVPDGAPAHLRTLAEYAVSGKSGAVSALRDFRKLTGIDSDPDAIRADGPDPEPADDDEPEPRRRAPRQPLPGETCPTCGKLVFAPDPETLNEIAIILQAAAKRRIAARKSPPSAAGLEDTQAVGS